ncbi:hypothetical protein Tco_0447078, partial [Tanacetum coccineum]
MVGKVLISQEFEEEIAKVSTFLVDQGRELGRRESRDLSLIKESGMNQAGLKKESWDCLKEITNAPELSTSVLHFVL